MNQTTPIIATRQDALRYAVKLAGRLARIFRPFDMLVDAELRHAGPESGCEPELVIRIRKRTDTKAAAKWCKRRRKEMRNGR